MRKNTKGRYIQHISPNPEKGKAGKNIPHKPKVEVITTNLWGIR